MYEDLGTVTLKSDEKVQAGVIKGPDPDWAKRIEKLLEHKGEPWNWQNSQCIREDLGIDMYFYILHRDGKPFSNIMTAELQGVGNFGHVWTAPKDRKKGACSLLMQKQMEHFISRKGNALFLGTTFDSTAYHIYSKYGFNGIEDKSGNMAYYASSPEEFEAAYFKKGKTDIQPVSWLHWPSSPALFLGNFPGLVRCAPLKRFGRSSTEQSLLYVIRDHSLRRQKGEPFRALALCNTETTAVTGLAVWDNDPLWPDTCLVDIYCHPDYWDRADDLLASLPLPETGRYLAFGDSECTEKHEVLIRAGFRESGLLPGWLPLDSAGTTRVAVIVFKK